MPLPSVSRRQPAPAYYHLGRHPLAWFGNLVQVIRPVEVRHHLARLGAELGVDVLAGGARA